VTWYSGTHQWWRDYYIGPDHALDPERYFIVAINQIGSGLSTSPHNADGPNAEISTIDEDMFFPPRDCKPEHEMIPNSEFRVVNDIAGHLGLFATVPTYMPQIDQHLGDLLATEVGRWSFFALLPPPPYKATTAISDLRIVTSIRARRLRLTSRWVRPAVG
jgi:homoserine acetyltransferase